MPKGCLNKLILAIILMFIGLTVLVASSYIGYLLLQDNLKKQLSATNLDLRLRAEKLAKFSSVPPVYIVTKAVDMAGVKLVIANHAYSGQTFVITDPAWIMNINKKNISIDELEKKIKTLIFSVNNQDKFKINNFTVERKGTFAALGQSVPYMKISFSILSESYNGDLKGMIGILNNQEKNKNLLILSYNNPTDYRQLTAERFFQNINF